MSGVRVRFEPSGAEAEVEHGSTVHEAAAEAGVLVEAPCGGLGTCGACRVRATGTLSEPGPTERAALSAQELASGIRLACLARMEGVATIELVGEAGTLRAETGTPTRGARVAAGRTGMGAAVDVGTTTIAASVFDLSNGSLLGTAATLNSQTVFGHDVMTRVSRALSGDANELRRAAAADVGRVVRQVVVHAGHAAAALREAVVVGNPAMMHLLLGRDVSPLATAPYEGALTEQVGLSAADAGVTGLGDAHVLVGPAVSAFVGADAVAGMIATGLTKREHPTLLIDLGTNGELVLQAGGLLLATSAAAGPALEGVSISSGMRAESGAIERVSYGEGSLWTRTIDDTPARGVCGSGLLDAVAAMLDAGVLDADGLLHAEGLLADRVSAGDQGLRFDLAPGVHLTQQDVRQLQLAKSAVSVAVSVLLEEAGIAPADVREVLVGGGFGSRVRPASLVRIGMLPAEWGERVTFHGNTALAGASAMLLDPAERSRAVELARSAATVGLATREDFQKRFLGALELAEIVS